MNTEHTKRFCLTIHVSHQINKVIPTTNSWGFYFLLEYEFHLNFKVKVLEFFAN